MPASGVKYKDCIVAPGCDLYRAIQEKKWSTAEQIYQRIDAEFRRWYPNFQQPTLPL